jgi:hypothetical protein
MRWRVNLYSNNVHRERVKSSQSQKRCGFGTATPTLAELQTGLDSVRREVRNLTVMGMDPSQPPDQAALIKELERSARAEMRLRTMALEYAKANSASIANTEARMQRAIDPLSIRPIK